MNPGFAGFRSQFPILGHKTYLISNSLGAMPVGVYDRMHQYAETWATKGVSAWEESWWDMALHTGNVIAPLIGAGDNQLTMHPNITTIHAVVYSCFNDPELRTGRDIIVGEKLHFPSVLYVTGNWAKRNGCSLRLVHSDDGITIDTQKMIDAIDERTLLVVISHVLFKSAYIQDVDSIVKRAHEVGAYVVLDAYQSAGIMPIDVKQMDIDFLAAGVLKWLCGGPGGCFLYVKPELQQTLQPDLSGWLAHRRPFDFDTGPFEYADGAARFLNGTPSIPAMYAATEGPKLIREAGIDAIREQSVRLTSLIIEKSSEYGYAVGSPLRHEHRGGTVTLDIPHGYETSRELIERNIFIDYRKGAGIRIAPHFYNTAEETVYAVEQIKDILDSEAYTKHTGTKSIIT
jgi:kynureninase